MNFFMTKTGRNISNIIKLLKMTIFISIILFLCFVITNRCYAESKVTVGKSDTFDPEWTLDEDFWDYTSNYSLSNESIKDAAYSPTLKQWVCLLAEGDTLVSRDLKSWTRNNVGNHYNLESIVWVNNKYIACGDILLYSYDGIKWNDAAVQLLSQSNGKYGRGKDFDVISKVYWNGSKYLAYGCNIVAALLYISDDGINWRLPETEKEDYTIGFGLCWNGSTWLAVGNDKAVLCSYDEKWKETNVVSLTFPDTNEKLRLEDCVWTGKEFCALDEQGIFCSSLDGKKWKIEKITNKESDSFKDLIWNGKTLITYEDNSRIAYYCTPGEKWKEIKLPFSVQCIRQAGNKLYAFSSDPDSSTSFAACSADGLIWNTLNAKSSFKGINKIEYANGYFYIQIKNDLKMYASKNGINLTEVKNIVTIDDIAGNKQQWLALDNGFLYKSTDGVKFEYSQHFDYKYSLNALASFSGGWCIVGDDGVIFTSKDGLKFNKVKSPTKENLTSIYSDDKLLIAYGENSTIIISKDNGATWSTAYKKLKGMKVTNIVKGDGIYIAALDGNTYSDYNEEMSTGLMSVDGVTWKTIGLPRFCDKITYFKGYFIALTSCYNITDLVSNSEYWTSEDGEHWVNHYLEESNQIIKNAVVGNNSMIMWNSSGEMFITDGSGENVQNNVTINGRFTLPDGIVANKDGVELTMTANVTYINVSGRTCGQSVTKIKPGDNSVEYSMPIKLTNADRNPTNIMNKNVTLEINVEVKSTMSLVPEFYIYLYKDTTSSDNTYNVELLKNTYTFNDAELESNLRDLCPSPDGPFLTEYLQRVSVIVLKNFNENMVQDINHMTALKQIIVPLEFLQEVASYFPYLYITTYDYDDMYEYLINRTLYGAYIYYDYN